MKNRKNISLSILIGLLFWFGSLLTNQFLPSFYKLFSLVIFPIIIGIVISFALKGNNKHLFIYCGISIIIKYAINTIQAIKFLYEDNISYNYVWDSIRSLFFFTGPIQICIAIMSCYLSIAIIKKISSENGSTHEKNNDI